MASDLDMYADDFDLKEKEKLENTSQSSQDDESEDVATSISFYIQSIVIKCLKT